MCLAPKEQTDPAGKAVAFTEGTVLNTALIMITDSQQLVTELHRVYCALTGSSAKLLVWERDWLAYVQTGYTKSDLESVLFWLLRENKKLDKQYQRSVWLSKLIGDLRHFDDLLNSANAANRNHKPITPKAQVLQQFRGMSEPEVNGCARKVGDIIADFKKPCTGPHS